MKKILEYWPLLTVCVLYFGFCNLHFYYKVFNIEILSFVNSNDILMSLFPQAVILSTIIYVALAQSVYSEIEKTEIVINNKPIPSEHRIRRLKWLRRNIQIVIIIYFVIIIILDILLQKVFGYKPYDLITFRIYTSIVFLGIIYYAIIIGDKDKFINENPILLSLFLIVYIGNQLGTYRSSEAQKIKAGISEYKSDHITFSYNGKTIQTNKSLISIGQTTDFLFLYDIKNKKTQIYNNSKIDDLEIR